MPHKIDGTSCHIRHCNLCDKYRKELEQYQKLEEQGKLIKLPCKIGDFIYQIPSKVNYDLNILSRRSEKNRVYEQRVYSIRVYHNGEYLLTTCEGLDVVISDSYKETWFLTREEAEQALKALGESEE